MFAAILIFFIVVAVTAVLFGFWVLATVGRGLVRGLGFLFDARPRGAAYPALAAGECRCPRSLCHAANPADARFCRRCGAALSAAGLPPIPRRRVAAG